MAFFTVKDKDAIVKAIEEAEAKTSGEIRVHVEKRAGKEPLHRAQEVFQRLGMHQTKERNGVLIYLVPGERRFAILGDEGIHRAVPDGFWDGIRAVMEAEFRQGHFREGVCQGVRMAGEALATYFPHQKDDKNELTNEISEG
ncbi:MAG TPA: TPM domain-containing protein [Bacillota bacterium]|nr:TPM domain-containing protein [Bacillota bacterium]